MTAINCFARCGLFDPRPGLTSVFDQQFLTVKIVSSLKISMKTFGALMLMMTFVNLMLKMFLNIGSWIPTMKKKTTTSMLIYQ